MDYQGEIAPVNLAFDCLSFTYEVSATVYGTTIPLVATKNTVSVTVVCREQDSSPTGVTLKCVKDPFTRKRLIFFNFAKRTFIIAKQFLRYMHVK